VSRRELTGAALAVALFFAGWAVLHLSWLRHGDITDLPVYERYGAWVEDGRVPYADFRVEYPPLALPAFVVPALVSDSERGYRVAFEALMAACGAGAVLLVAWILSRLGASPLRAGLALALVALAPLLLGPVVLSRFDLWPALLTVAALAALVAGRGRLGAVMLGAAIAAKLYPVVLLPLLGVWLWRRGGRREAAFGVGLAVALPLLAYLPFALVELEPVLTSIGRQLGRPLQLESLGAAVLVAGHHVLGYGLDWSSGHGSQNLDGTGAGVAAALTSLLQVGLLAWVWVRFARGPAEPERLLRHSAAALAVFVSFGKVLSPQFLIWLIPVVPLVAGRRGLWAGWLLAAACVLTQIWFPRRYWDYVYTFDSLASWAILARDLALVALVGVLLCATAREREPARSP
jgi:hypothetical protein